MKTTIDLPDDLLIEAKQVAARRRTTLKEMLTRSLRREIGREEAPAADSAFEIGPLGLPVLKGSGKILSAADFQRIIDATDEQDDRQLLSR